MFDGRGAIAMKTLQQVRHSAADLHWLAFLLTGRREIAVDATAQAIDLTDGRNGFFSTWMVSWSRRLVIARALAAVREDLARSVRRTALRHSETSEVPPPSWVLDEGTTKSDLERALLPIDLFPRAAVLLLVFERVPLKDAAILLDSEADLVKKAMAAGVRELTINLTRLQGCRTASTVEIQHA
jgi:DNA-directed RNA polymerase specialized sigma24 family protein